MSIAKMIVSAAFLAGLIVPAAASMPGQSSPLPQQFADREGKGHDKNDKNDKHDKNDKNDKNDHDKDGKDA